MKDKDKTKEQLIKELVEVRQRTTELETSENTSKQEREALKDSRMELSTILDNTPIVMLLVGREGSVQKLNQAAIQFAQRPAEEMIGLHGGDAFRCLHSFDDPRGCGFGSYCQTCVERLTLMDTFQTGNSHHQVETKLPFLRGEKQEELTFLMSTTLLTFSTGAMVLVCIEDITERKLADEEIHLLLTLTQAVNEGQDFNDALQIVLSKLCEETGWDYGEVWMPNRDASVLERVPVGYSNSPKKLQKFQKLSKELTFSPNVGLPERVWSSQKPEWIQDVSISPASLFPRTKSARETGLKTGFGVPIITNGQVLAVLIFFRFESCAEDIRLVELVSAVATQLGSAIQRKRAEEELKNSREQLRSLSTHLQTVREEERMGLAREMHDELGQALTALKIDLSWLSNRLPKGQELLLEKVRAISGLVDMTIETVQRISTELRPGVLDDLGLPAAIEWQAGEFQNRAGIKCEVSLEPETTPLDKECATAVFRIFQAALTNVIRHADATRVTVSLKEKAGKIILKVRDNGKGITEEQISSSQSIGIIGMRERAYALRGEVEISGIQGKGTTVTVSIPLDRKGETR